VVEIPKSRSNNAHTLSFVRYMANVDQKKVNKNNTPDTFYGILERDQPESEIEEAVEQVRRLGYAIIDSECSRTELQAISSAFDHTWEQYITTHGKTTLENLNERYTVRAPLLHGGKEFLQLAMKGNLLAVLRKLFKGKFILNQQNGIVNPSKESYNQGAWHRDLPYQHFVSSRPIAINALFCIDDFTFQNGGTFVLPASHKSESFPSVGYINRNAVQVEASAGSYILLDCMLFHAGGYNSTNSARRAVNHVYTIPYFKQQVNLPANMRKEGLTDEEADILGFNNREPQSIIEYLSSRKGNRY
jgi:ectoine hydroxylase-related dioxygenase (phytanoyl-CoA dioxygenase family)